MGQPNFWDEPVSKLKPELRPSPIENLAGNLKPIVDLFDKAAVHLKWPKVRFGKMQLIRTRYGTVMIKMGNRDRRGTIDRDGVLGLNYVGSLSANLQKFLRVFAKDPVRFASLEGIRTGNCCFCARELSTPESVTVGYGPVCAEKWGLPWGHRNFDNKPRRLNELMEEDI